MNIWSRLEARFFFVGAFLGWFLFPKCIFLVHLVWINTWKSPLSFTLDVRWVGKKVFPTKLGWVKSEPTPWKHWVLWSSVAHVLERNRIQVNWLLFDWRILETKLLQVCFQKKLTEISNIHGKHGKRLVAYSCCYRWTCAPVIFARHFLVHRDAWKQTFWTPQNDFRFGRWVFFFLGGKGCDFQIPC